MSRRPFRATPANAALAFAICFYSSHSTVAQAQDRVGDSADVVGLNLNMSPDQARQAIQAHWPQAKGAAIQVKVGTDYYQQVMSVGYYAEIEPTILEQQRGATDRPGEFVKAINSPNAPDLIGILRYKGYRKDAFPTSASVYSGLVEKYGEPNSSGGMYGNNVVTWVRRANVRGNGFGMLTYNGAGAKGACSMGALGTEPFLFEEAGSFFANNQATFEPPERLSIDTTQAFTNILNTVGRDKAHYSNCGLVLQVLILAANNHDYASSILERIVDFDRANTELGEANAAFWTKVNEAKALKLKTDAGKKPDL